MLVSRPYGVVLIGVGVGGGGWGGGGVVETDLGDNVSESSGEVVALTLHHFTDTFHSHSKGVAPVPTLHTTHIHQYMYIFIYKELIKLELRTAQTSFIVNSFWSTKNV